MRLEIYDRLGPAGTGGIDFRGNTVNILWFRWVGEDLRRHARPRCLLYENGAGAGGVIDLLTAGLDSPVRYASDLYLPALRAGKARFPGLHFLGSDGSALGIRCNAVDVAIIHDVLEHVEQPEEMLRETRRILKPGGKLYLFVPCEGQRWTVHDLWRRITGHNPKEKVGHINCFKVSEVVAMVRESGFDITERRQTFHLLGQISDILGYLVPSRHWARNATEAAMVFFARAAYVESRLLPSWPGLCLELIADKAARGGAGDGMADAG